MDRRSFVGGVAVAICSVPLIARGQQPAIPIVGFLNSRAATDDPQLLAAFRQGLKEIGYVEGQNVAIVSATANRERIGPRLVLPTNGGHLSWRFHRLEGQRSLVADR